MLGLLLIAWNVPAVAQPFKDSSAVPAWAYAAVATLAAQGFVQGYTDGTFRGDRAMTRDEMAVVVARILAKVESIENQLPSPQRPQAGPRAGTPPPPPPPQVTQADIDLLLRLVNELQDELADLAVRVPAAEGELRAIAPRIDNVRVTGTMRFRENVARNAVGAGNPINGNPLTTDQSAETAPFTNGPQYEFKLNFDGAVVNQTGPITVATGLPFIANNLHVIAAVMTQGDSVNVFNSGNLGTATNPPAFGSQQSNAAFGNGSFGSLDSAFLDWTRQWGTSVAPKTLETWLGRFGANPQPNCMADCYPVQFGPFGLLLNDTGATWSDSTADTGVNVADGLRVALHLPDALDLQAQALIVRVQGATGSTTDEPGVPVPSDAYIFGEDAYGIDANIQANYWTRIGAYWVGNQITPANSTPGPGGFGNAGQWHVYGPGGGSMNPGNLNTLTPGSYHCAAVAGTGIACPAAGNGWGAYLDSDIVRYIHLDGEYAQWNDAVFATSDTGYQLNLIWDLGDMTKINPPNNYNWTMQTGYLNYGQNFYPPYGSAEADAAMNDTIYPGNAQGITATMSFNPTQKLTVYATYFGGQSQSNGQALVEGEIGFQYAFSTQAQIWFLYRSLSINGVNQLELYRAQIDYYF